jgi:hypothetical protein
MPARKGSDGARDVGAGTSVATHGAMTRGGRWAAAVSLFVTGAGAVACGAQQVDEDRGPALTPAGMVADMPNWSADGTEIYFVHPSTSDHPGATLDAVSLSGDVRVVDEGKQGYSSLAVARDGTLYYAAGVSRQLFSSATTEPLPITLGARTDVVAISPDGGRIAYYAVNDMPEAGASFGQLKLLTFADGSVVTLSDELPSIGGTLRDYDRALAFSPASDRLFYVISTAAGGAASGAGIVFDLATGAADMKTWELGFYPLVHWGTAGLRLAAARLDAGYEVLNLDTAERALLPAASNREPQTDVWSPDGTRIAYWTSSCLESCGLFSCCSGKTQHELHVADLTTGGVRRVAATGDLTIAPGLSWIYGGVAFSPDSRHIAYAIDGRIHVRDLP